MRCVSPGDLRSDRRGAAAVEAGCPLFAAIAIGLIVVFVAVKLSWRLVLSKLRFCIVFHPNCLQVGRGLARCLIAYDDVEIISLAPAGSAVKIKGGKVNARVVLDPEQVEGCFPWLRRCCSNAVAVDENGREHLPTNPRDPDRTLDAMQRHCRRKAWFFLWGSCYLSCFFVGQVVWMLTQWWQGKIQVNNFGFALVFSRSFIAFGLGAVVLFSMAWKWWRMAARLAPHLRRDGDGQ